VASHSCTIGPMAKKRSKTSGSKNLYTLYVRVPIELGEAMEKFCQQSRPETNITGAVKFALEKLLEEHGLWPPPERKKEE